VAVKTPDLQAHFNQKMISLGLGARTKSIAVAVSGGSDSMALALLAEEWARTEGVDLLALSVDHCLRPQSASEVKQVATWLGKYGISCNTLRWDGPHPTSGIQQAARDARYRLMTAHCQQRGITSLLLGHQMEDQAETMLMRLSKGSGLEGLAAMRDISGWQDLKLLRPLLGVTRDQLRQFLMARGQEWIDDPSNDNLDFTRTQVGTILAGLQDLPGSDLETISLSVGRLARASRALDQLTSERFDALCEVSPFGFVRFPDVMITDCPEEMALRLLSKALALVQGEAARIKLKSLEHLYERLFIRTVSTSETLAGCQISKSKDGWIVCREPGRTGLPENVLDCGGAVLWDNRYQVVDTAADKTVTPLVIRRIGADGWRTLNKLHLQREERELPAVVRNSLPAVWSEGELVAAPLFSCDLQQSIIAKDRIKMVFRPLI